jgi:predicted DNA-binding protein (UPF0278 family)
MPSRCETCPFNPEVKLAKLREQYREMARKPPLDSKQWAEYTVLMIDIEQAIRELGGDL